METVQERETIQKEVKLAVRHSAVYGLGNVAAKAVGFLMLPFYTYYLNPTDYGILEILDLSITLFGMILHMGITPALLRAYAAAESAEDKRRAVSTAFLFVFATGVGTFLLGLGFVRPASAALFGPKIPAVYLLLSFSSFILSYIANMPRTYLRALEASGTVTLIDTIALAVMLGLNIYFIAVLKLGLLGILLSSTIVGGIQAVLLSWWTVHKVGLGFESSQLRQMAAFGLPLIFSNLGIFALNFSDRFFLQHLRSLDLVGVYAVGYKFAFMINYLLVQPFYVMWQSRMFFIRDQPNHRQIFSQIFILYSLVLIYAGLTMSLFSPEIVGVMAGPKFVLSKEVIPIVAFAYVFYGIGYYVQLGMFLTNKTGLIGIISAAAAILNLGLNYVLISQYGMLGAAWATLLSFVAIAAGSYWLSQRVLPLSLGIGRVMTAIFAAMSLYIVGRAWSPGTLGLALFGKGMLLVIFPLIMWKARILSAAELSTISSTRDKVIAGMSRCVGLVTRRASL